MLPEWNCLALLAAVAAVFSRTQCSLSLSLSHALPPSPRAPFLSLSLSHVSPIPRASLPLHIAQ